MLHTRLAAIDEQPLGRCEPWLLPALAAAAVASGLVLALASGQLLLGGLLLGAMLLTGGLAFWFASRGRSAEPPAIAATDYALVTSALALCPDPAVLTDGAGGLIAANKA